MRTIHKEFIAFKTDQPLIADLGCGKGRHSHLFGFEKPATVVGIDIMQPDVKAAKTGWESIQSEAKGKAHFVQGNLQHLPIPSKSLDLIICSEVLEHLHQYQTPLQEMYRCLKPGGSLAVSVPRMGPEKLCWWLDKKYHLAEGGHIRIFHELSLLKEIEAVGFNHYHSHYEHGLHSPYWWLRNLLTRNRKTTEIDDHWLVKAYHHILVAAMMKKGFWQKLDRWLAPMMGKSVVMYFTKS